MEHMDALIYGLLEQAWFTEEDNLQVLHDDLEAALLDRLNAKIMAEIPADKHEKAGELLHDENTDAWETFVQMYIPEYDEFLADLFDEFAEEYLASMDDESVHEETSTV
jgi:hypothetical protein